MLNAKVVIEPIAGIENPVPQVVVCRAVPLIGARFRLKRELTARIPSVFGRIGRALHAKLLESVHRHQSLGRSQRSRSSNRAARTRKNSHIETGDCPHIGAHTVHGVVVGVIALAIHVKLPRLAERGGLLGVIRHNPWR